MSAQRTPRCELIDRLRDALPYIEKLGRQEGKAYDQTTPTFSATDWLGYQG
jgi:hypothetical protein